MPNVMTVRGMLRTCGTLWGAFRGRSNSHMTRWTFSTVTKTKTQIEDCPPGSQIKGASIQWSDKATLKLRRRALFRWQKPPQKVLIVKKINEVEVAQKSKQMASWLLERGLDVYVEEEIQRKVLPECKIWNPADPECDVDFGIILGGDGTLLHYASLFADERAKPLPPCISFGMGSLGFMTNFSVEYYESILESLTSSNMTDIHCTLRTRLDCTLKSSSGEMTKLFQCLNECVIDKGQHPGLGKMALTVDEMPVTVVQGDGLIISTPSGSTGYNLAVGGAMVAPSVPCMLVTPIAPSTLSFRPIILPESSHIEVHIPYTARTEGRAIFDGHKIQNLNHGDSISVKTSIFPIPVINSSRYDEDWFKSIKEKLQWNVRVEQKPLYTN